MAEARVLIFEGDDEYAIAQEIARLQAELKAEAGSLIDFNLTRLDGAALNMEQLPSLTGALPLMASRRLVILSNMAEKLPRAGDEDPNGPQKASTGSNRFYRQLEQIPETTLLILEVGYETGDDKTDPMKKKLAALRRWAADHPQFARLKSFNLPKGKDLVARIQKLAKDIDAEIRADAAARLAYLVDDDLRRAAQELAKIRAQMNYARRPITIEDVSEATPDDNQGNVFALTDSLAEGNIHNALDHIQRMLEEGDYFSVFGAITSHFRKLIFAREVLDRGGGEGEVIKALKILRVFHSFPAEKITRQARRLSIEKLENAYRLLLEVERAKKLSLATDAALLDFFASAFIAAPDRHLMPEVEQGIPTDSIHI